MRKIFIKHICNILLLSHIPTYKYELTLIVGGLTLKGQVGVLLGEHRGWMLHMATLIKGRLSDTKIFQVFFQTSEGEHQHAFLFPNIQHSTFHRRASVPLSLQNGKRAVCFPFTSFRILVFYNETFHLPPRNLRIEDFADPSRRLADL